MGVALGVDGVQVLVRCMSMLATTTQAKVCIR